MKKRVCYISCYHQLNYPRRLQFIEALKESEHIEAFFALNQSKTFYRFVEVLIQLIKIRWKHNIDVYILGFRGNDLLFPVRLITLFKPLVFDSFVPFYQAMRYDNKWGLPSFLVQILAAIIYCYEWLCLRLTKKIITDTVSHREHYIDAFNVPPDTIEAVYLGSSAQIPSPNGTKKTDNFIVFYYGSMLPLHGLTYVLKAAQQLKEDSTIQFEIIGGKPTIIEPQLQNLNLTNVRYTPWMEFDQLMEKAQNADLCIGGPLGNTAQAQHVITGKTFQFLKMGKATLIGINKESKRFDLKDKSNCLLIEQADSTQIIEAILWAREHNLQLNDIGKAGHQLYNSLFREADLGKKIIHTISHL